ncbi:MAG TPA: CotH kinase family protein [Bacteroidota bacterium]|nr:CotH kinase family protein [Bacteroidota bacterium]
MMRIPRCLGMFTIALAAVVFCRSGARSQVPEISITLSPNDSLELFSRDPFSNDFVNASLSCNGHIWKKIELRFKGRSNRPYPKKSFRIRFPDDQPFRGARQINLHAMYTDKSFLREKLAWSIFEDLHDLAPHAEYVRLTINQAYQGLYLIVDHVDKYFLGVHKKEKPSLYEAAGEYALAELNTVPDKLLKLYYTKHLEDDHYDDLKDLIRNLQDTPDTLFEETADRLFDMNSVYHWFTANILTMSGDSYSKNYYLYKRSASPEEKWVIIPWDYDLTFGLTGDPAMPVRSALLNDGFAYTFPPLMGPQSVLKDRLWANPSMHARLVHCVDTALQTFFRSEVMDRRIDSLAGLIRTSVEQDHQKRGTIQDFDDCVMEMKYFVHARRNYLLSTFIHSPRGTFGTVTLPIDQKETRYDFIGVDGRQLASFWPDHIDGLDSLKVIVHPDAIPPNLLSSDTGRCVRRWVELAAIPPGAKFSGKFQWMYQDISSRDREVGTGVNDERSLKCFRFDGTSWKPVSAPINPLCNTVTFDSIDERVCGKGSYFAIKVP